MPQNDSAMPVVAIVGTYQVGKSTLMNCLLADSVAHMGDGNPTTHVVSTFRHGNDEIARLFHDNSDTPLKMDLPEYRKHDGTSKNAFKELDRVEFVMNRECLRHAVVMDTPGLDARGEEGSKDTLQTMAVLDDPQDPVDFVLVVLPEKLSAPSEKVIREVARRHTPFAVIMNCMEDRDPGACTESRDAIEARIKNLGASPVPIAEGRTVWPCNLAWYLWSQLDAGDRSGCSDKLAEWCHSIRSRFKRRIRMEPSKPQIAAMSRVEPVLDFFRGGGMAFAPLRAHVDLSRAFDTWRQERHGLALKASA